MPLGFSKSRSSQIPSKLQAVIKFGYEEIMKRTLNGENFDSWIADVMCHAQEHWLHESLGTEIHFEVSLSTDLIYLFIESFIAPPIF